MDVTTKDSVAVGEIERRTIPSEATLEYRDDPSTGQKTPVIVGYAAVFNSESRNLGGFVEVLEPRSFDNVLRGNPDVVCVWNHNKDAPLGRIADGRLRLSVDAHGLRYEVTPDIETSVGNDVTRWVKNRTVQASSFAFAVNRNGGETWEPGPNGLRLRRIKEVALLDDVSPVLRPAYDSTSVVVSRRALEMAAGEANRPNQTMSNAAKRGLKVAAGRSDVDVVAMALGERIADRQIITADEIPWAIDRLDACLEARSATWAGTPAWIEYQLLGGDSGERWLRRRSEGDARGDAPAPKKDRITGSDTNEPGSAEGSGGDITLDDAVVTALGKKASDHNEAMKSAGRPDWAMVSVGALKAVYRRGAGAFSTSHRPGMTRGQWAMARVNAFLYLAEHGKPENSKYVSDNDLLRDGHPKRSEARDCEGEPEERADGIDLRPTAAMAAAARRGLKLHEDGRSGDGLKPETVARAKRIAARETLTPSHVREMRAWFRRHKVDRRPGWDKPGDETPGYTAWLLWAGSPGWRWAEAKVAQMERAKGGMRSEDEAEMYAAFTETAEECRQWTAEAFSGSDEAREDDMAEHPEKIAALYRAMSEIEESYGPWSRDDEKYMEASPYCGRGMYCRMAMKPLDGDGSEDDVMPPAKRSDDEPKGDEPVTPPEQTPQQREDAEVIAAIAAMDAAVLATHLHGADSK